MLWIWYVEECIDWGAKNLIKNTSKWLHFPGRFTYKNSGKPT
jgi:hypothetical protein